MKREILFLLALFILAVHNLAFAEIIDGPANIREKPNGKILITLNDGANVEILSEIKEGVWYPVGLRVFFDLNELLEKNTINKDAALYDMEGKEIGKTVDIIKSYGWDVHKKGNRYSTVIEAYTHRNNIREITVVEYDLARLIKETKGDVTEEELKSHFEKFGYEEGDKYDDFKEYFVYESGIYDPSPMPRIELIFHKGKLLVVLHKMTMYFESFKPKEAVRGYKIFYVSDLSDAMKKDMENFYFNKLLTAD